jgi:hypothetical protein
MGKRLLTGVLLSLFVAGCGKKSPSAPTPTLGGSVTDPAGDANGVADLVSATIDVSNGTLVATVSFAPGSVSGAFIIRLDTDENPATGFAGVDGGNTDGSLIGWEYSVSAFAPQGSTAVVVTRSSDFSQVATATSTFPTATQTRVSIPLTAIGGDDGRLRFKVISTTGDPVNSPISDRMPNTGVPAGEVK